MPHSCHHQGHALRLAIQSRGPDADDPDGETRITFIVGDPIAQVKSPRGSAGNWPQRGENRLVLPAHVPAADFAGWFDGVRRMRNLDAIIVTIPHKAAAFAACDSVSDRAEGGGSVNVMCRTAKGGWHGENTDGRGFADGLAAAGFRAEGSRVLLVGAGGAGAAIGYEVLARGAATLALHDLDDARRDALLARLATRFPGRSLPEAVIRGGSTPWRMRPGRNAPRRPLACRDCAAAAGPDRRRCGDLPGRDTADRRRAGAGMPHDDRGRNVPGSGRNPGRILGGFR